MSELAKTYDAKKVDPKWYKFWEERGFFTADSSSEKEPYCIVMPPPNVTGVLHMGHAFEFNLQDILIRWKRMLGFEVLWLPGTDHAGIATQTVVEQKLIKTTGKRRKDFDREEFLKHIWELKENHQNEIINQIKLLGCSCDWSRLRFTMDEQCSVAVRTIFKKLYDDGLIYQGDYLVNWDPVTQTALADDEVEYEDRESSLWYFRYPYSDGSGHITIATTRPETMLGDTAVAVSPKDHRYREKIGKTIDLPLTNRPIPIIADRHVDPEFGTGALKITPAHDPNDYQIGITHNLPRINIMTPDGHINENGGEFKSLSMEEARSSIVKKMDELGLLKKVEPFANRVGISYRSKATIEPFISKQWFVKMDGFAKKLEKAVKNESLKLIPKSWENTYFHWIKNLRDWCISRQLWWGHRIPIWYNKKDQKKIICYDGEGNPPEVKKNPEEWKQDEDVLDTWFSSALWPFSTLGWPKETQDFKKFYPNSLMLPGFDILFFWVARMNLMGEYAMGKLPYPKAFLHGLIFGKSYWRKKDGGGIEYVTGDEKKKYDLGESLPKDVHYKWEKLSKSKGNIIDPLELIDEYGTDAVRMALCASATHMPQIDLDRRKFEEFKNFTNKLWNGARFIFQNLDITSEELSSGINEDNLALEDKWILSAMSQVVKEVNEKLETFAFDHAAIAAYDFFWKEFCAYYLEIAKPTLFGKVGTDQERKNKQKILVIVLCNAIRLIHPIAPFITEELFQMLKQQFTGLKPQNCDVYSTETIKALQQDSCMIAPYPQVLKEIDYEINETFALMERIIYSCRNIRGEMKIQPGTSTDIYIIGSGKNFEIAKENKDIISSLIRSKNICFEKEEPKLPFSSTALNDNLKIIIPLPEEMQEQEKARLKKEKEKLKIQLEKIEKQLANKNFTEKAPKHLVEKQQALLHETKQKIAAINQTEI